jgi:putative transposase
MARPLRYEAAGAVYHVIARGDGGENVFDDDKDRFAWTDLMEKAHGRFGWRVHAWEVNGTSQPMALAVPTHLVS